MKEKTHLVCFPVFDYCIMLVYTSDIVKSRENRSCVVGAVEADISDCEGLHSYNKTGNISYVFITPTSTIGTLIHELWHAIYRMFKKTGMKFDNETVAYHLGYLVDEVNTFMGYKKTIKL